MATDTAKASCEGSVWNYVVTAHKPTAVRQAIVGNFTSPTDVNLIVGKSTRLELHTLTAEGLQGVLDVPMYGRVSHLELFRPKDEAKDLLYVLTEQLNFCVLEYDTQTGELVTRANGEVRDVIGSLRDGALSVMDKEGGIICLNIYNATLKVIPMDPRSGKLSEPFNIRIDQLNVVDMAMLAGAPHPTVALLYEDAKGARHLATYEVAVDKKAVEGPLASWQLDPTAHRVVAVPKPAGGVVVLASSMLSYLKTSQDGMVTLPIADNSFGAVGAIDSHRFLLGDWRGGLHLLVLLHSEQDNSKVTELKLEPLGVTSAASALAYLDNSVVFVGSRTADSQLIQLLDAAQSPAAAATAAAPDAPDAPAAPPGPPNYVQVLDSYVNLAPIVDFAVVDLERQGQGQVVTCSNLGHEGSLRVVRNGIGINEQAAVELAGIKGIWSLRATWMDAYDTFLVLTFVAETHVLGLTSEEELDEADIAGLEAGQHTLLCANMASDHWLQVTSSGVRLVDCGTQQLAHTWSPPPGVVINVAACSPKQVLVGASGGTLVYLEASESGLQEKGSLKLSEEIACIDMSPVGSSSEVSELCAVGTWGLKLQLLTLPGLQAVTEEVLPGEVIPRSVLLTEFEGITYVLCGLGDGVLHTWRLDTSSGSLCERKKLSLGTKPLLLHTFKVNGSSHVLAASDRPTVIHAANKKLLYSNLNENDVSFIASFNASGFPDSLAMAKEESMIIGTVDQIQKLHIRTVPLREQPRRICHQDATNTFGVLTHHLPPGKDTEECYLRVLDEQTFDIVASHSLDPLEVPCSLASLTCAAEEPHYYAVGTAYIREQETEASEGRLLLLQYLGEGRLEVVAAEKVKGSVNSICSFQGKVLASVSNHVCVYTLDEGRLRLEVRLAVGVNALYLASRGDFIAVGDLMRSISLLLYKPNEKVLELRARDLNPVWLTAVQMLDDDTYVGADNNLNLFVARKNADSAVEDDRYCLQVAGRFHLGSMVNRFRPGSLVMKLPDNEASSLPTQLFCSVDGTLGLMASLPQHMHAFLDRLQTCLRGIIKGVGGLSHATWRAHKDELPRTVESHNFIDGDLIEQFLELPGESMQQVASQMGEGISIEELYKKVEELARLH